MESTRVVRTGGARRVDDPVVVQRDLHLRGALGTARSEQWNGREHLIVPVVALVDGVIHAVNAPSAERVTANVLAKAANSFNGRPLTLGHPSVNGAQVSANDARIMETHAFGQIFNARMSGSKLVMDAYVDVARAATVGGDAFVTALRNGELVEVSVGTFVAVDNSTGEYNGRKFSGAWLEAYGDHLAFLIGEGARGACSIDMGCGAHRAAQLHLVTAEGIDMPAETEPEEKPVVKRSLRERLRDLLSFSEPEVTPVETVAELQTAAGKRNSAQDQKHIQSMHDESVALGAQCVNAWTGTYLQGESDMKREDLIKTLTACDCSGFTPADTAFLTAASDEQLERFRVNTDARKAEKAAALKTEAEAETLRAASATKVEPKEPTEAEFYAKHPQIKTLVDRAQAQDKITHATLVASLKTAQSEYPEVELGAMSVDQLSRLAKVAKVDAPVDYSVRGVARAAGSDQKSYAPPDPYARDLAAARAKTVN